MLIFTSNIIENVALKKMYSSFQMFFPLFKKKKKKKTQGTGLFGLKKVYHDTYLHHYCFIILTS